MATRTTTYSADKVDIVFANVPIDSGYADGEFVTVEVMGDDVSSKAGADGEVVFVESMDDRATAKVMLLQTSLGNTALSQMRSAAAAANSGPVIGAFSVFDRSSGVRLAFAEHAVLSKPASISRGKETKDTEWTFILAHGDLRPEGNPSI